MKLNNIKIYKLATVVLSVFTFLFFQLTTVQAEDAVGFNYQVEYPKNQVGGEKGYFDLKMKQGDKQTVKLLISNPGENEIEVNVAVNGAKTNSNGVIEYGETLLENDASLKFPFEEIVSAPESVKVKSKETVELGLEIKMPETSFDGMILGGIQLKKAEEEDQEKKEGATVKNEYAYVIAMVLKLNDVEIKPEIAINKAFASQENYRNTIGINLSNITASLHNGDMSVEAQITKKGSQEVLFERKQSGMSIAPNTQMNFPIPMNGERMVPGDYEAAVLVTIGDQKWEKNLSFKINKEEADKYNKRDVGLVQDRGIDWKLILIMVASVLLVVTIVFMIVKLIKKSKRNKSGKSSRKSSKGKR